LFAEGAAIESHAQFSTLRPGGGQFLIGILNLFLRRGD
jgi:hypothetical protein